MPVPAQIDGDLKEPGREPLPRIEAIHVAHHAQPCLLIEILDVAAAGLAVKEARQPLLVALQQLAESELVAVRQARRERFVGAHRSTY